MNLKETAKPNLTISSKTDVTNGRPKAGNGFSVKNTPAFSEPSSIGAPKDVTENKLTKKDLNIGSTNPGKVTKIGK